MTWLVTGGAGYIGGHIVRTFCDAGRDVVVLDDLSTGDASVLPPGVPFVNRSVGDIEGVRGAIREYDVTGVVHLAAKKAVAESVADPLYYWRENVAGMRSLLEAMVAENVGKIVYSSSAAVYGTPPTERVTEDTALHPESPYGETKVAGEWMLNALATVAGLSYVTLRYFNVAGTASPELADRGAHNLIPLILSALAQDRPPQVFGDDYDTRDGSCIRDYIHVVDLAEAHLAAADALDGATDRGERLAATYNVGRGEGVTVKEVMSAMQRAVGEDFAYVVTGRRPGDPGAYAADPARIEHELGWRATHDLDDMARSAVEAWRAHAAAVTG